ncbi:MAG: ParB N-terminal domain-containing protein [Phycisphaerae bacterium]|jgi:ParB-like chromosome segregation protein Spo0J|nr:ParB N-terminal domain-containing protein [Phycisphaerae bacterium]
MELKIEYVSPESLRPADYNPRKISRTALEALAGLMDAHGFVDPVIARRSDGLIIGGHQRIKANALRKTPRDLVPVVFLEDITDDMAMALNLALNSPSAQGRYDHALLAELVVQLDHAGLEVERLTGFDADEIANLTAEMDSEPLAPLDDLGRGEPPLPDGVETPEVVIVFELDREQYASAREHFDHLIDNHNLSAHVHFEDER